MKREDKGDCVVSMGYIMDRQSLVLSNAGLRGEVLDGECAAVALSDLAGGCTKSTKSTKERRLCL